MMLNLVGFLALFFLKLKGTLFFWQRSGASQTYPYF